MTASSFIHPIELPGLKLKNNLFAAPMAGISDLPLRLLCKEGGAGLVYCEMVSSKALEYKNEKTQRMIILGEEEHPVSVQIFGSDAQSITAAVETAVKAKADIIDINSGCPVKKITKIGAGAALMQDEKKFAEVIKAAVKQSAVPVSVKIRIGLNQGAVTGPKFAKIAENEGAKLIAVHGRYAVNFHNGPVDYEALKQTVNSVKIPIICNGGITDALSAKLMFENTGAHGIMVGRGFIGNPFVFSDIERELRGENANPLLFEEKINLFKRMLKMVAERYGERKGMPHTRKLVGYWLKGFKNAAQVRNEYVKAVTLEEAYKALDLIDYGK